MEKSGINSDNITQKEIQNLKDISSLMIANYGATDMVVTINNVSETVPAYNADQKYARTFQLSGDGTFCDIQLTIDFVGGSGQAVLRYRQYKPKKC